MVNHGRTLLLNLDGATHPGSTYPGEEYVSPDYKPIRLPPALSTMRDLLLGIGSDRALVNYRLRQLMALVHSTELGDYLTALDPRITYWPIRDQRLFNLATFGATIRQLSGSTNWTVNVVGSTAAPQETRRAVDSWDVQLLTATSVRLSHRLDPFETFDLVFSVTDGVSSLIQIPNTPYSLRLVPGTGTLPSWAIDFIVRPATEIRDIYLAVQEGYGLGLDIFGLGEPYDTLRGLWDHAAVSLPYRLGAVVVAWIYRADEIRRAGG